MINIAILGYGVVGSGVYEVLQVNNASIKKKAHEDIQVKRILDLKDFSDLEFADKFTKDFNDILNDDEISIVVEVMGGVHPSFEFVKKCLENGKSVVTSNKELVATKGAELLKIAKDNNLNFLFEASVGGGIPIIRPLSQCLAANEVYEIAGILNGTTNFILTKMIREGMGFEDALALAQKLGYAERNPSADVDGADACRKICILASLAYGYHVYPDEIHTEGIRNITLTDVEFAKSFGGRIKLIGRAKKLDDKKITALVAPHIVSDDNQLSTVDDVFNGILVKGNMIGDVMFYGKGAGKLPTASAVVADVIDCVKHFKARKYLGWEDSIPNYVVDYKTEPLTAYVRASSKLDTGSFYAKVTSCFGVKVDKLSRNNQLEGEYAFVVKLNSEYELEDKLNILKEEKISVENVIRVLE